MASEYEFKEIERKLSSLEKELNSFDRNFDTTLKPILNATFNRNEYGERALEQKVNKLINNSKIEINNLFNDFVDDVRRYCDSSIQSVKTSAKEISDYVDGLNNILDSVNDLNNSFFDKKYLQTIVLAESLRNSQIGDIKKYALLVELESYDKLCALKNSDFTKEDYSIFENYHLLCSDCNATNHIASANNFLFIASYKMFSIRNSLSSSELYKACINGLKAYSRLSDSKKSSFAFQYSEIYKFSVPLFNERAEIAYNSFKYIAVKQLLGESVYFNKEDITNKFFTDSSLTPKRVFAYLKEHGNSDDETSMDAAFNDSKPLAVSSDRESYIEYWISSYDKYGWKYCCEVINMQENRYSANDVIVKTIISNYTYISQKGSLIFNLYENYYSFLSNEDNVDLDLFMVSSIRLNEMINLMAKNSDAKDKNTIMYKAIREFDGLSYGMITKYFKICSRYNETMIKKLNVVLDDSSNRLYGKPYRKDLKHDENKSSVEKTNEMVRLVTAQVQEGKKKLIIFGAIAVAVAVAIILIVFLSK